jgi:chromosome segregation ATPase
MLNMKNRAQNKGAAAEPAEQHAPPPPLAMAERRVRELAIERQEIEAKLDQIERDLGAAFTGHDDDQLRALRSDRDALQRRLPAVKEDLAAAEKVAARALATEGASYIHAGAERARAAFADIGPRLEAAGVALAAVTADYERAWQDLNAVSIRAREYQIRHGSAPALPNPESLTRLPSAYVSAAAKFAKEVEKLPEHRAWLGEHNTAAERNAADVAEASSKTAEFTWPCMVGGQPFGPQLKEPEENRPVVGGWKGKPAAPAPMCGRA